MKYTAHQVSNGKYQGEVHEFESGSQMEAEKYAKQNYPNTYSEWLDVKQVSEKRPISVVK